MRLSIAKHAMLALVTWAGLIGICASARGQGGGGLAGLAGGPRRTFRSELSDTIRVEEPNATERKLLERARGAIGARRFDEAAGVLQDLILDAGGKLFAATPRRYVPFSDICHIEIAGMPSEGLAEYRGRVDPRAAAIYEDAAAKHDRAALRALLKQYFCSSAGGDALLMLGDLELEAGNFAAARGAWRQLLPSPPTLIDAEIFNAMRGAGDLGEQEAMLLDRWYAQSEAKENPFELVEKERMSGEARAALSALFRAAGVSGDRLAFPDSSHSEADVQARMLLASVLEREGASPREAIAAYRKEFGNARGKIAGREVVHADYLEALVAASGDVPPPREAREWPTFAGSFDRAGGAVTRPDFSRLAWRKPIDAEGRQGGAPYFPVIANGLALVATPETVHAFDLRSGEPPWGESTTIHPTGQPSDSSNPTGAGGARSGALSVATSLTVFESRLFARIGDLTYVPRLRDPLATLRIRTPPARLVSLDLGAEGKLLQSPVLDEGWSFEGPPVVYRERGIVGVRKSDAQSQTAVISFDLGSGRTLWRRFVCAAEPASEAGADAPATLLSLDEDTVYYATNLGAVAALDAETGAIRWLTRYPRRGKSSTSPAPAFCALGVVVAAPIDSNHLLGMDAATGSILWQADFSDAGQGQILGVSGNRLIVGARRLWWLNLWTGKTETYWPDGPASFGFGRGLVAGGRVYWPAMDEGDAIHVFDAATAERVDRIDLERFKCKTGNLAVAGGVTLIATADELLAFGAPAKSESTSRAKE